MLGVSSMVTNASIRTADCVLVVALFNRSSVDWACISRANRRMNTPDESPVPFPSEATTNPPLGVTAIAATFWAVAVVAVLA